jgi:hypothetical protein
VAPRGPLIEDLPLGALLGAMRLTACLRYPDAEPEARPVVLRPLLTERFLDAESEVPAIEEPEPAEEAPDPRQLGLFESPTATTSRSSP